MLVEAEACWDLTNNEGQNCLQSLYQRSQQSPEVVPAFVELVEQLADEDFADEITPALFAIAASSSVASFDACAVRLVKCMSRDKWEEYLVVFIQYTGRIFPTRLIQTFEKCLNKNLLQTGLMKILEDPFDSSIVTKYFSTATNNSLVMNVPLLFISISQSHLFILTRIILEASIKKRNLRGTVAWLMKLKDPSGLGWSYYADQGRCKTKLEAFLKDGKL